MYNPKTNRYHITIDVNWLTRMYCKNASCYDTEDLLSPKVGKSDKLLNNLLEEGVEYNLASHI